MPSVHKALAGKMPAIGGKVRTKAPRLLARVLLYVVLIDLAFLFLFPFLYILVTSVKTNRDLLDITVQWIPRSLKWENFSMAIKACNFFSNLKIPPSTPFSAQRAICFPVPLSATVSLGTAFRAASCSS